VCNVICKPRFVLLCYLIAFSNYLNVSSGILEGNCISVTRRKLTAAGLSHNWTSCWKLSRNIKMSGTCSLYSSHRNWLNANLIGQYFYLRKLTVGLSRIQHVCWDRRFLLQKQVAFAIRRNFLGFYWNLDILCSCITDTNPLLTKLIQSTHITSNSFYILYFEKIVPG
jgi:hypothetical protein